MTTLDALRTSLLIRMSEAFNYTFALPVVVFHPTSRCHSRCLSCDCWRNSGAGDLSLAESDAVAASLPELGTRLVVFSGGEPLLRPEVFEMATCFVDRGLALHLLTSGVLLERCADEVARYFQRVVVSLDAPTEATYLAIRGVNALAVVGRGVARLRAAAPAVLVTARATLSRQNFRLLPELIAYARTMALDGISILPVDVTSLAFGRAWPIDPAPLMLDAGEVAELEAIVERTVVERRDDFASGFVAETPDKLRELPRYFAALRGAAPFPPVTCNLPWMSVVVEADGTVRPCLFHERIGNVRQQPLATIVRERLSVFRATLDVANNPVCRRCVCSSRTGWRGASLGVTA